MAEVPWRQAAAPPGVASKLKSDFADHRPEPPLCVQNAMLTKDKKPFTYTPGGLDLSEIRSPRMARRLERNAMSEGVTPSQQQYSQQKAGPLPPSALAAMQPQLPVQVFPPGKIPQPPHSGPPPPPPPPMQAPQPLPLDTFQRPDMTKIIPDNPMALLKKTSGPVVKQDPILNKQNYVNNVTSSSIVPQRTTDPKISNKQVGSIYVPPINQNVAPQSPKHINQRDSPTSIPAPPAFYKRQPSLQQTEPSTPPYLLQSKQAPSFDGTPPLAPESPKTVQAPWVKQKSHTQEFPEWSGNNQRNASVGNEESVQVQKIKPQRPWVQKSFEKPDSDSWVAHEQVKQDPHQWQQPSEQKYQPQKQPDLQPMQQRQSNKPEQQWQPKPSEQAQYQSEPQQWQQRQPEAQKWPQNQYESQSRRQNQQTNATTGAQSPPVYMPQYGGVRQQVQNRENPPEYYPNEKVEVVIVNDPPPVFQHPGQSQPMQRQPLSSQNQNVRIIPIQVERTTSNGHSANDPRSFNRQQSWNSGPTQSNTFKVLQKITHTDGDYDENDQAVREHSPKVPHSFPQQGTQNRMKSNQGDQELMNKFKQGLDQDSSLHKETDPRYRGPHIPSKAFKFLQNLTSGENQQSTTFSVPQEEPLNNHGPKVRTIPIQIEGNGPTKTFVPPSEQTVSEPKKYMGSSIPSRSFKMLQAMTAPDECGPGQSDL